MSGPPLSAEEQRRVDLGAGIRDADPIPKVPHAGETTERRGHRVQIMHNGVVVKEGGYYGAWMTELIRRLRGHHEPQEEAVFHAIVQRLAGESRQQPAAMVELGAFWAYYSLWFRQVLPGARTVMVEPDPRNLDVGRLNFLLNDADGEFVRAAVGAPHGAEDWFTCESDGRRRRMRLVTLPGLLEERELDRVDLVLCDAQGGELQLLRHAEDVLRAGRVRFLVISTHHHSICGDPLIHQRCLALLRGLGAHVIAEHSVSESCTGDGLIAVSMDPRDGDLHVPVTIVRARDSLFGELEHDLARAMGMPDIG